MPAALRAYWIKDHSIVVVRARQLLIKAQVFGELLLNIDLALRTSPAEGVMPSLLLRGLTLANLSAMSVIRFVGIRL